MKQETRNQLEEIRQTVHAMSLLNCFIIGGITVFLIYVFPNEKQGIFVGTIGLMICMVIGLISWMLQPRKKSEALTT
jgi:hypothetical protein